jgi:1,4-alpha-glucan branching enzyme
LNWQDLDHAFHREWLEFHKKLLLIRQQEIIPLISNLNDNRATVTSQNPISVNWKLGEGKTLCLLANLTGETNQTEYAVSGKFIYMLPEDFKTTFLKGAMPPWSVAWIRAGSDNA